MRSYNIAMGQGVVADADLEVFTEALYSCTFIAGRSSSGARGGAFHYPADTLRQVSGVLEEWMLALRPSEVTLVFAQPVSFGMGTSADDRDALIAWFGERFPRVRLRAGSATAACMTLIDGQFYAGPTGDGTYWDASAGTDLEQLEAGRHRDYHLFDARPLLSQSSPAVVQEGRGGRSRRRRSFRKRCIVM